MYYFGNVKMSTRKRPFIMSHANCNLVVQNVKGLAGSAVSIVDQRNAYLAATGELFEREMLWPSRIDDICSGDKVKAYSIIDGSIEEIDKKLVYVAEDYRFIDSCGLATHSISSECIKASFEEFVERQSFIFSYLSKTPGRKLDLCSSKKYRIISNIFPKSRIDFYDISLTSTMYVIFSRVLHNNRLHVGLGCSSSIDTAIEKCIKEILQCKDAYNNPPEMETDIQKLYYGDYGELFFMLPQEKMWNAYNYLDSGFDTVKYCILDDKDFSIEKTSFDLYDKYKIRPLITFLQNRRLNIRNIKTTKVLDKRWFKSMLVKYYDKENLDYIEAVTNKKLDRECTFIPFP